uniref:phosphopyruvate hydratase n=1 Tax=Trichonympha agilis TaxID=63628 RepID=Q76DW2_9EUKA|nr:enolase [Trichonympha agilis]
MSDGEYFTKIKYDETIKKILSELEKSKPEDAFGVLSRLLKEKALPPTIDHLVGRQVLDSRGNPTVEVDVYAKHLGEVVLVARSSAPSGASTGSGEAMELRDKDNSKYGGKGTEKASANVAEKISPAVKGEKFCDLTNLDDKICKADGTELKTNIGGNACTAASFALAEAAAKLKGVELFQYLAENYYGAGKAPKKFSLPAPCFNILNGGKHAGGNLQIQEFMLTPNTKRSYPDQLRVIAEVYQHLGALLVKEHGVSAKNLGDEGGFAPNLDTPAQALDIIERAVKAAGYVPVDDVKYCLDCASSEFYNEETKKYEIEKGSWKTGDELIEYYQDLINKYPAITSIEDPFDEHDYETWTKFTAAVGSKVQIVGDDLYTTNPKTIAKGIAGKWANALLLKVNQIGTISEAFQAAKLIHNVNQNVMVSHRSGETCNSVIADIAVAIGAKYIKTGSTARGERIQKYTRLLQIYDYLKENKILNESGSKASSSCCSLI